MEASSEPTEILDLIRACKGKKPKAQELLYKKFYGYALGVCRRYSKSREEAIEIVNDGFYKVLTQLDKYNDTLSFKGWVRRIMINAAIDHFRKNEKHYNQMDVSFLKIEETSTNVLSSLSEETILNAIRQLPPSYQIVFNLYVIEGFTHEEISTRIGISVGTSKSNLSVARAKLMKTLGAEFDQKLSQNG